MITRYRREGFGTGAHLHEIFPQTKYLISNIHQFRTRYSFDIACGRSLGVFSVCCVKAVKSPITASFFCNAFAVAGVLHKLNLPGSYAVVEHRHFTRSNSTGLERKDCFCRDQPPAVILVLGCWHPRLRTLHAEVKQP